LTSAEWKRKAVHAGIGLFALTLRWLDWRVAAAAALLAILFNAIVLPRIGRGLYRDPSARHDAGIVAYPAMVLLLILVFSGKQIPIAAAVWAMMAFGDPAASIAGKTIGGPKLPWNPAKTWVGLLCNWAVGGAAAVLVFLFVSRRGAQVDSVAILVTGAAIYAFLESVRAGLDDNIVAAFPTALAVYQMSQVFPPPLFRILQIPASTLLTALAVNVAAAALMGGLRIVRRSGAVAGGLAGFVILAFGGWGAYALLWIFFLAGTLATKLGYRRKAAVGVAQKDSGRRGAAHVAANCLVPASLLLLGVRSVGYVGAFGAALADTLGTEIGTLFGKKPFSPLTLKPLTPGTPGAISLAGTAASLAGAAAIAAAGIGLGLLPPRLALAAALGGFLGALAESLLSAMGRRFLFRLDHEFANGLNTFVGAMVALRLANPGGPGA
jgi:uncharacterized protein (TIGR00297 family)